MGVMPILIAKAGGENNLRQSFVVYVTRDRHSLEVWSACVYGDETEVRPLSRQQDAAKSALLNGTYMSLAFRALGNSGKRGFSPVIAPGALYRPLEVYPPEAIT